MSSSGITFRDEPAPGFGAQVSRALQRRVVLFFWRHSRAVRALAWIIRHTVGIVAIGKRVVAVNHEEVRTVLSRDVDFSSDGYRDTVLIPNFMIALGRGTQYFNERALMSEAVATTNMDMLRRIALDASAQRAAELKDHFDVVDDYAMHVPLDVIEKFGGIPLKDRENLVQWLRHVGAFIPGGGYASDAERKRAVDESALLQNYLDEYIRHFETCHWVPSRQPTAVERLARSHLGSRSLLHKSLNGLMIFAHPVIVQGFTLALYALIERPKYMQRAYRAAADGDLELVRAYTREAMRFRPVFPALMRSSPRPSMILHGDRRVRVQAGASVIALLTGGNFDRAAFHRPGSFDVTRPPGKYLMLGYGMHECVGKRMVDEEVPAMMLGLLKDGPLRTRAFRRRPHYDGFVADHLQVERY